MVMNGKEKKFEDITLLHNEIIFLLGYYDLPCQMLLLGQ